MEKTKIENTNCFLQEYTNQRGIKLAMSEKTGENSKKIQKSQVCGNILTADSITLYEQFLIAEGFLKGVGA